MYQAILDNEAHVNKIDFLTTLAGYVHWQITGEKVLGIGDASGMLPIDPTTNNYSAEMVAKFDKLIAPKEYNWKLEDILPKVLSAGENAGVLTPEGSKKLDASGHLKAGIPVCPPEGDAGTGMVATNAVKQRTGNVSAGTSSFSMIVLEKDLSKPYEMIDMVTTPDGSLVAMVHCNNCTSDLNAWVNLFKEYQELLGIPVNMDEIYSKLYNIALTGDTDCGGLLSYNYISGEPVTGFADGRPLFVRSANDKFNLANFMRTHLYASVGVLKIGNDILFNEEKIKVDRITGHGGLFRTKGVGQRILAAALQQDRNAHIVRSLTDNLTSYVLFETPQTLPADGLLQKADTSCLVMIREDRGKLLLTVSQPDLALYRGPSDEAFDKDGKRIERSIYSRPWIDNESGEIPVTVTLKGWWKVAETPYCKLVSADKKQTVLRFTCKDAASFDVELLRK